MGVIQAVPSEGEGRTFESCRVRHFGIRYWRQMSPFVRLIGLAKRISRSSVSGGIAVPMPDLMTIFLRSVGIGERGPDRIRHRAPGKPARERSNVAGSPV
jgi:hypothetical protein